MKFNLKDVGEKVVKMGKGKPIKKIKLPKVKINKEKVSSFTNNKVLRTIFSKIVLKVFIIILIVVALVEVALGVLIYGFKSENAIVKKAAMVIPLPVAAVNQYFITYNDYIEEKDYIHHFYASTEQGDLDYETIDKEIMNQLIENKLISYQALKNGIKVNKSEVDETLNQIIEQNGGQDKVEKVLKELYGLNLNQFRDLVQTQMLRDKVNTQMIAKVGVRHILVRVEKDAAQDKVDAAKAKIDGYLAEINGGLDFGEAAKKYSEDTGSAETGGVLDPFAKGEMVTEFSDAAFSAKVGDIVGPVRTEFGWHLIKIEQREGKIEESFTDWLKTQKDKSLVFQFIK